MSSSAGVIVEITALVSQYYVSLPLIFLTYSVYSLMYSFVIFGVELVSYCSLYPLAFSISFPFSFIKCAGELASYFPSLSFVFCMMFVLKSVIH